MEVQLQMRYNIYEVAAGILGYLILQIVGFVC